MITLSKDNGFVKVNSWEEIIALPGYTNSLDPSKHKLKAIIGRYIFKDYIKCGLSDCHTPHGKGYIANTMDGITTNIGKDCGKKYFGVDFETLSNKFDRDLTEMENRERLWSFSFKIDEIEDKISSIRKSKNGADWVNKKSQQLLTIGGECPNEVVHRLKSMVKARTSTLTKEREASESEIETAEISLGRKIQRPYFVEDFVTEIKGIEALYPENNLKNLLIDDLESNLKLFKSKNIDVLSFEELKSWSKWINSVDQVLESAERIVVMGSNLLTKENLEPFNQLLNSKKDKSSFNSYLRGLEV